MLTDQEIQTMRGDLAWALGQMAERGGRLREGAGRRCASALVRHLGVLLEEREQLLGALGLAPPPPPEQEHP